MDPVTTSLIAKIWARIVSTISLAFGPIFVSFPAPESSGLKSTVVPERFDATLRIVGNSGMHKATPGIHTVSGYTDFGDNRTTFSVLSSRHTMNASSSPPVL
ncbi:hypothetical protein FRB97_008808 [Tulasnella sp. 331]|nr:hypothetical protein FRB97_008808 [Tulasnella sp. 331]